MSRPPRLHAFNYVGPYRYFLTICAHNRKPAFKAGGTIDLVREQISYTSDEQGFEIPAFCFMDDHLHLLAIGVDENADFSRFVKVMKQRAAWRYARRGHGRLWQEGYYDRVLRTEEATRDVVQYIIANPVRAGLVSAPEEYPHWGSLMYTREEVLDFLQVGKCRT